jgi:hypothetical protein
MTGGVMRRSDRCLGRRGRNGSIDLKAGFGEIFDEELGLLVAEGGLGVLVFDTEGGEVCLEGGEIGEERVRKGVPCWKGKAGRKLTSISSTFSVFALDSSPFWPIFIHNANGPVAVFPLLPTSSTLFPVSFAISSE